MNIISQFFSWLGNFCIQVISALGYPGVFILMAFESMILPMPSELVMPFAGYLAATGKMNFFLVVLFSSLGSLVGSLAFYYVGKHGGNKIVMKYGRYLLLDKVDLLKTEEWFKKKGERTVLISRFIPVVRHFISIPAGIGKMDIKKFCLYTLIGATVWNSFLAYLGYLFGSNWSVISKYGDYVSMSVLVILTIGICVFVYIHVRNRRFKRKK
jgi:membrane protein DedA with SNARE-associated domain